MKKILKFFPQIFLFLIWLIFSYPYFLKGLTPFPSKYLVSFFSPWNNYFEFPGPIKNNAMPDIITQIYPWKHLAISAWSQFQIPLWNPFSFSGTPLLANYQSGVFSPFNILFFIFPFIDAWSILVLLQPLLAGVFMYLLLRSLLVSKTGSLISAISFMFCGFIVSWMGYATLGFAILFLPLSLFAIEKFFTTSKKIYPLILSLSIPLSFFSGHFQISIYFSFFMISFLIYRTISGRKIKLGIQAFLFVIFGFLLTMPQLLPSIETYLQSGRSGIFQRIEIIPWQYITTLFAPDFFGNPVTRNDWFGHYAEWNGYIGLIPLILAIYSILNIKKNKTLFLLIVGLFAFFIAYNTPLTNLILYLKVPVLSTSAASRIIVLFSFSFAVLAGIGYDQLLTDFSKKKIKKITLWLSFIFLIFLTLWVIVLLKFFLPTEGAIIARQNLILPSGMLFLAIFLILISALFRKKAILLILVFLTAFDLLRFAIKWQSFDSKNLVFGKTPVIEKLEKIQKNGRILGNFGAEVTNYYELPSIEGYDAVYAKRYGQLIASLKSGKLSDSPRSVVSFPNDSLFASKAANLLSIDYIVHKISDGNNSWVFPFWKYPDQFKLVFKDQKYEIYQNARAYPFAFLVNGYVVEKDPQNILNIMLSNDFDLRNEIVLEEGVNNFALKNDSQMGEVEILTRSFNKINIQTESKVNKLLFISNSFSNGWNAKIDGKKAKVYRADFTFQAIPIEKGFHKVELEYYPMGLKIGYLLAIIGGLGIIFFTSKTSIRKF
ncbi:MAG: hypothetical protein A2W22_00355 [Candidatus Levybacteria bacterium RBG_16_35_11]|nr:MAG: hypothetical protein A2W22_00355 [Candidatus Levybacteria bacterium RBG_16_35_11]